MRFQEFHVIIIIIFLFKPAISLLEPIEALIFPLNVSMEDGGVHRHPVLVFYMLYITTAFRHALQGGTVNDAILLDSSMRSARSLGMRNSLRMKEGGAGYLPVYNYTLPVKKN